MQRQSVAEHQYTVALWAGRAALALGWRKGDWRSHLILTRWALNHDQTETRTGDIPTPFKRFYDHAAMEDQIDMKGSEWESLRPYVDAQVKAIVKWADLLEAAMFLRREYDLGNRMKLMMEVRKEILERLHKQSRLLPWSGGSLPPQIKEVLTELI